MVMTRIFVAGLRLEAEIGIHPHEIGRTQPLIVDVELEAPSAGSQTLAQTVNYEMVGEAARAILASGHIDLVEAFAEQLAQACLQDSRVTQVRVRVEKPQALAPHAAAAGVEIILVRS